MRLQRAVVSLLGVLVFISCAESYAAEGLERGRSSLLSFIASKCITIGDKRFCLEENADDRDQDKGEQAPGERSCPPGYVVLEKPNKYGAYCEPLDATKTPGERSCPPGYVVLEKPNKYGAFCEPKEGLPTPEAENCKFGMIGTPPNCNCPSGTEFLGFRGCVKYTMQRVSCELLPNKPGAYVRQDYWEQQKCFPLYGKDNSRGSCIRYQGGTDPLECCCEIRVYDK